MKTVPPLSDEEMESDKIGYADWKEGPQNVIEKIDQQLKPFGLEVVLYDVGDDGYHWAIAKVETPR